MFKLIKRSFSEIRRVKRHANGMTSETPYVNDKIHGAVLKIYDDGKYVIENWKDGFQHGKEFVLYRGTKLYESDWFRGTKLGDELFFRSNGSLEQKISRQLSPDLSVRISSFIYDEDGKLIDSYVQE